MITNCDGTSVFIVGDTIKKETENVSFVTGFIVALVRSLYLFLNLLVLKGQSYETKVDWVLDVFQFLKKGQQLCVVCAVTYNTCNGLIMVTHAKQLWLNSSGPRFISGMHLSRGQGSAVEYCQN